MSLRSLHSPSEREGSARLGAVWMGFWNGMDPSQDLDGGFRGFFQSRRISVGFGGWIKKSQFRAHFRILHVSVVGLILRASPPISQLHIEIYMNNKCSESNKNEKMRCFLRVIAYVHGLNDGGQHCRCEHHEDRPTMGGRDRTLQA
jgi:hypothetical protein